MPGPSSSTTIVRAVLDSETFIVIVPSLGLKSSALFKIFPKACSRSIFSAINCDFFFLYHQDLLLYFY